MSVGSVWDLSSDAELITAVRSGESAAFGVLYERHVGAARTVARQYSNSAADADDAVQDAFSKVFTAIQSGGGPDVAFRAYLFTVLRRVAMDRVESVRRAAPTDDLATFEAVSIAEESSEAPTMEGFERGVVSQAYASLPERWQAVLWYTEVESLSAAEIAPILGLTANGVAALAYRAREGLRQAYLQQHLAAPQSEACTLVNSKLGAYVRGGLAKRETLLVDSHLEECHACRALVLELGDVNHGMRAVIGPLVLGFAAVGVLGGIGFGGAVSAAKAGAAAAGAAGGAGASGGAGAAPHGGEGAGSGGAGAGVGAGTAGAGVGAAAAAGALVGGALAGAGAAVVAGSAAGATGTGAGGGAGAGSASGGAAAGAGAGAAGASGATGGLAGLVAAIGGAPALLAGAAALAVVIGAVGVAGMLGLFSPGSGTPGAGAQPSSSVSQDAGDGGQADGSGDGSGTDGTSDQGGGGSGTDGTGTDGTATDGTGTGTGNTGTGSTGTGSTGTGGTGPQNPGPQVVPAIGIDPVGSVTLVAGVPTPVQVTVRNASSVSASGVRTELTFDPGTVWTVTATPGTAAATVGAGVPTARTDWTCLATSATTAACTLPSLAARTTATLHLAVLVDDTSLDGTRDLGIGLTTYVAGGPRTTATLTATLSSPPARVTAGRALDSVLTGLKDGAVSADVVVPVANNGGTTASRATVRVQLPADLPAGVTVEPAAVQGTYWSCAPAADGLTCTAPAILPRTSYPLGLRVTVPAIEGAAAPLLDVDLTTALTVLAPAGDGSAQVTVRSAPGEVALDLTSPTSVDAGLEQVVGADVHNVGGTTLTGVTAHVTLPTGVALTDLTFPGGWTCTATGPGADCVLPSLGARAVSRLELGVLADVDASGELGVSVQAPGGATTATGHSTLDVMLPDLAFGSKLAADLVEGRTGSMSFSVTNAGRGAASDVVATLELPASVSLGDLPADLGDWTCTRVDAQHATCRVARLGAGATEPLVLPARATAATSGQAVVTVRAANRPAVTITSTVSPKVASSGLGTRDSWSGAYAVTEIGAPVLTCDQQKDAGCATALGQLDGGAQDNNYEMTPVASSTARLDVAGRVVFAGLYWSANRYTTDTWTGPLDAVEVRAPGASDFVAVRGSQIADVTDNSSRRYYQSFADVTSLVQQSGTVEVRGVATSATRLDPTRTYYGGWALVVVYASPGADRSITLYDGGSWIAANSSSTFAFAADAAQTGRFGVVAWDGDRGVGGGDQLVLDGSTALVPLRWDGSAGQASDAFTSTAMGSPWANSLGVDAKAFATAPLTAGVHRLTASTGGDQYLIGAVTVTTGDR